MPFEQPNIVLITTDQQRHDTVGPLSPAFLRTPHLDRLAYEGITFSQAYADCPVCIPSRVSIMTGKYVTSHGISRGRETATSKAMGRHDTLPAMLRECGYQTAAIGKMHFGPTRARHGFDEMILPDDYYRKIQRSGLPWQPMRHGLGQTELYPSQATVPESQTLTSWIAEECVEYILERRDPTVPFFLWCSHPKPHPPLDPPEPYYSMYRNAPIAEPAYGDWSSDENCPEPLKRFRQRKSYDLLSPEVIREARAAYYGLITHIDHTIGRVMAALTEAEQLDNTLIIFSSDHGEYLGDHHCGSKVFFHESSAHIPFIMRLPKTWDNRMHGSTIERVITLADILPTCLKAAGGTVPKNVDGLNLISLARGETEETRKYLFATSSQYSECDYLALTDGTWKYIWYPEGGREQLFNLDADPTELKDLSLKEDFAEKKAELYQILASHFKELGSIFVQNGYLVQWEIKQESEADRRNATLWVWHTDYHASGGRH